MTLQDLLRLWHSYKVPLQYSWEVEGKMYDTDSSNYQFTEIHVDATGYSVGYAEIYEGYTAMVMFHTEQELKKFLRTAHPHPFVLYNYYA